MFKRTIANNRAGGRRQLKRSATTPAAAKRR
jgi:hypothetical protein